jgi:hypothetical protein
MKVDPFSIFNHMKNLTTDQAELIFSLFIAQNADRKISEFVEISETNFWKDWSNEIKQDLLTKRISDLKLVRNENNFTLSLVNVYDVLNVFSFYDFNFFRFFFSNSWKYEPFNIFEYISLQDKV